MNPTMLEDVHVKVDEDRRVVHIVLPPFAELTEEQARAALERALQLRREWESKGYEVRY